MDKVTLKPCGAYAWVLVLALGLMSAGTTGSYSVVAGGFMTPVCEDLGIDYTAFSYYFTGTLLGLALTLPFAGKVMDKVVGNMRLVAIAAVLLAAGALMGRCIRRRGSSGSRRSSLARVWLLQPV